MTSFITSHGIFFPFIDGMTFINYNRVDYVFCSGILRIFFNTGFQIPFISSLPRSTSILQGVGNFMLAFRRASFA